GGGGEGRCPHEHTGGWRDLTCSLTVTRAAPQARAQRRSGGGPTEGGCTTVWAGRTLGCSGRGRRGVRVTRRNTSARLLIGLQLRGTPRRSGQSALLPGPSSPPPPRKSLSGSCGAPSTSRLTGPRSPSRASGPGRWGHSKGWSPSTPSRSPPSHGPLALRSQHVWL
ncbi:hypothetical protein T484DRAFT_1920904, partial [Baffinella frigidus]